MVSQKFSTLFSIKMIIVFLIMTVVTGCSVLKKEELGGLQVITEGETSEVYLNGGLVGKTPYLNKELKPGTYTVRLEPDKEGLASYETTITLHVSTMAVMNWKFGESTELSGGIIYEMEQLGQKDKAVLSIASIPDGTIVKLDDVSQGFTPVKINQITAGTHRLIVSLPSYQSQEQLVNVLSGYQMNITVKLARDQASLLPTVTDLVSDATGSAEASVSATPSSRATTTPAKTSSTPTKSPTATSGSTVIDKPYVKILPTTTGWLRVRKSADASAEELAKVDVGEMFPYLSSSNGWHEIEYDTGKKGWVSGQYAEVVK